MNNDVEMILLYIDPGTGSMLFSLLFGLVTAGYFFARNGMLKLKSVLMSSKVDIDDGDFMPYIIFSDDKRYWEFFKSICDQFENRKTAITYWTCSKDDPALETEYRYVTARYIGNINRAAVSLNHMKAGICLSTTPGLDVYQWKRSKDTMWYVHQIHGIGDARAYRMFGLDSFDAVLVAGEHQIDEVRQIEGIRNIAPKEIALVGEPHVDSLMKQHEQTCVEHDSPTILLAPSWGKTAIFSRYGSKIISAIRSAGYDLIIRPHPQSMTSEKDLMTSIMNEWPEDDHLSWDFANDNFGSLSEADVMISDFSSVIWDYIMVFNKPVICADVSFDDAPYDLAWVDDERWDIRVLNQIAYRLDDDLDSIGQIIDEALNSNAFSDRLKSISSKCWGNRGRCAETVAEYMINKYGELRGEQNS